MRTILLSLLLVAIGGVGCSMFVEEPIEHDDYPAILLSEVESLSLQDPVSIERDTVAVGETMQVTIKSIGNGCVDPDRATAETTINDLTATVRPRDVVFMPRGDEQHEIIQACPDITTWPERTVEISFDQPGEAVIKVMGSHVTDDQQLNNRAMFLDGRFNLGHFVRGLDEIELTFNVTVLDE